MIIQVYQNSHKPKLLIGLCILIAVFICSLCFPLIPGENIYKYILYEIRIPRMICAIFIGGALAASGVLSQSLFQNALASPDILGTSSVSTFAAAMCFYLMPQSMLWYSLPITAFSGAFLLLGGVVHLINKYPNVSLLKILLLGFSISACLHALTALLFSFILSDYQRSGALLRWTMGSLSNLGWEHVGMLALPIFIGWSMGFKKCLQLDTFALGRDVAFTLGISYQQISRSCLLAISIMVGATVSVAGPVGFVGLIIPHFCRKIFGPKNKILYISSTLAGSILVLSADFCCRAICYPEDLEIGVMTSLIGSPLFGYILFKENKPYD